MGDNAFVSGKVTKKGKMSEENIATHVHGEHI